ncbi:MAG: hypothetical protein KF773_07600 [Deltaproteobacteria bacterium]|nr:hypothetical protein [Deltaproteobacteria bacterium]
MVKWVAVSVVVVVSAVLAMARFASADADSDRVALIRSIDDRIGNIADKLSSFESRRDFSNADDALSYAREVRENVDKLANVKGSDSRAAEIVSRYPGYIDAFREATRYLKKIKELQFTADGIVDRCVNDEANLQTLIRNYVAKPDDADDAIEKLTSKGRDYARTWVPLLEKLKEYDRDIVNSIPSARFSVSDSYKWPNVVSSFNDAASRMATYWRDKYSPIDGACKRLALGDNHPDIVKASEELRKYTADTKQTVKQLKKDYNAWLAETRKLRELTTQDHEALREVMCKTGGEYDMKRMVEDVADRWASQISGSYGTILGRSDGLVERGTSTKLGKYKGSKEVVDGVRSNRATLEKIKSSDLQGSNNPKIKTKLQYGTDKHNSMQSSMCSGSSNYIEFEITRANGCDNAIRPGSNCRADCVLTGSECLILEIKPDSQRGIDEGRAQVEAYRKGLAEWYARDKAGLFKAYPKVQDCERDGKLVLSTKIEPYRFCPDAAEAKQFGEDLDSLSSDVSESE